MNKKTITVDIPVETAINLVYCDYYSITDQKLREKLSGAIEQVTNIVTNELISKNLLSNDLE